MLLKLHCTPMIEEDWGGNDHALLLDLTSDPARLLFTLHVCRLMMPPNTAAVHLTNWREIESVLRQLSTIYQQAHRRRPRSGLPRSRRRPNVERRSEH